MYIFNYFGDKVHIFSFKLKDEFKIITSIPETLFGIIDNCDDFSSIFSDIVELFNKIYTNIVSKNNIKFHIAFLNDLLYIEDVKPYNDNFKNLLQTYKYKCIYLIFDTIYSDIKTCPTDEIKQEALTDYYQDLNMWMYEENYNLYKKIIAKYE